MPKRHRPGVAMKPLALMAWVGGRKTPPKGIYTDRYENNGMRSELWAVGGSNTTPDPNLAC